MENPSFKIFDHPEFHRRGIIGSAIVLVLILIVLFIQFFQTTFPLPEAEGLAVAFGNVEEAGGGNNPNPEPTPNPNTNNSEPVKTDDNATVDDKDADKIDTDKKPNTNTNTNTDNNSNINNNALFGGIGNGSGNGKQGDPYGAKDDIGGTGRGDQGNGNGEVGNRKISQKCPSVISRSDWDEEGTAWVYICVAENGTVIESSFVQKTNRGEVSNITKRSQQKIAEDCAREYQYEAATGQGQACGTIPIRFRKQ